MGRLNAVLNAIAIFFLTTAFFAVMFGSAFAAVPTIDNITLNQSVFSPTENGTTTIMVSFNVTDLDGAANLNNSECSCQLDNNAVWAGLYESANDSSCDNQTIDADTVQYTCFVDMQFWFENNTYSVNATIKDNESYASNATQTFTYTALIASAISSVAVSFGAIASDDYGTNKTDAYSPLTITNTGNQLLSLKVTGAELSDSLGKASNISTSNFFVKNDSSAANALMLNLSQQTIPNATAPVEDSAAGGNTEQIWWFFSVPNPLAAGIYSGIWVLAED